MAVNSLFKRDWKGAPFANVQGLPRDMKPVKSFRDRDAAWAVVAAGIRALAEGH